MMGFGLSIEPQLWALLFVMVRISAAFLAAPVFSAVGVPVTVRVALAGAIGVLVLNTASIHAPDAIFSLATFVSVAAEALVGVAIGFVLQIAFSAPLVASELIGSSMGLGFAGQMDPVNGHPTPALGNFLSILLLLLFLAMDGHLVLIDLLVRSYQALPPGAAWLTQQKLMNIALFGSYAFMAGLLLALPAGFLLLCMNLIIGMISRAAPALNLFVVGLPASLALGVAALLLGMPAMGDYMQVIVHEAIDAMQHLVIG